MPTGPDFVVMLDGVNCVHGAAGPFTTAGGGPIGILCEAAHFGRVCW